MKLLTNQQLNGMLHFKEPGQNFKEPGPSNNSYVYVKEGIFCILQNKKRISYVRKIHIEWTEHWIKK